ncbi:amidohydrolase family protein [Burkholderia multivorans]|uniref:amidohydrolase family protein n=1 Tax=Burkholderia multivorans TaxID=87883 RepID=UPI001C23A3F4|nr:amidohydrolase family protein [Burkholderia multivorans]MBU9666765.1 amidohydrolase family protein [Burkholderia multivorans]HEF4753749.1 amidohydrolase family protein [Burkholderia multivorans]
MGALRIDSHQHFWRYRAADYPWIGAGMGVLARDYLPGALHPLMHAQALGASIAVQARAGRDETAFLLDLARDEARIAAVVGWEDLRAPQLAERVAGWRGTKLRGFRHQLQDEADVRAFVDDADFTRGVAWLQANGYVYDVLVFERQLPDVQAFCARHDAHWLVLDHAGKPALAEFDRDDTALARWRAALRELAALPHVVCKLSGLVTEADWRRGLRASDIRHIEQCLDTALDAFGPQRLMFGSDWPVCLLAASYDEVASLVERWAESRLSAAERSALWGGTAARCYALPEPSGARL